MCAVVYVFKRDGIYACVQVHVIICAHVYVHGNQRSTLSSFLQKLSILIFGKVSCCNLGLADLTRLVGWKASGMPWLLLPSTSSQQHTQMFLWRLGIEFRSPCTLLTELSPQALVLYFYGRLVTGESIEFFVLLSCIWSRQLLL